MSHVPVRVSTLRGDQKINFDLYVQLGAKYVLYIRRGDSFEGSRLDRLKEKKLRKLYILPDDEKNYRAYLESSLERAYDRKSDQSLESRSQVIQGLQQAAAEEVFENPTDAKSYATVKEGSKRFTQYLLEEEKALRALLAIENSDQTLAAHGVTVASLAVGIAKKTGLAADRSNLHFVALGGLIHDLGHYATGLPVGQPLSALTDDQTDLYKKHPLDAAAMVKDLAHIDQHVVQIILEHEELVDGSGFPQGLTEKKLNPYSVLVSTANTYDRFVSFEKSKPADALKRLVVERIGRHPLDQINALKAIVSGA